MLIYNLITVFPSPQLLNQFSCWKVLKHTLLDVVFVSLCNYKISWLSKDWKELRTLHNKCYTPANNVDFKYSYIIPGVPKNYWGDQLLLNRSFLWDTMYKVKNATCDVGDFILIFDYFCCDFSFVWAKKSWWILVWPQTCCAPLRLLGQYGPFLVFLSIYYNETLLYKD